MKLPRSRTKLLAATAVLAMIAALGWWQRAHWLGRYWVQEMCAAEDPAPWIERLAALDAPWLVLPCLANTEAKACAAAGEVLAQLSRRWDYGDRRNDELVIAMQRCFAGCPNCGKEIVLTLSAEIVNDRGAAMGDEAKGAASELLTADGPAAGRLKLAQSLLPHRLEIVSLCRQLAEGGMQSDDGAVRTAAVQLLLRRPLREDEDLLLRAKPLLHDGEAEVRRAALLVLGPREDLVASDDLLVLLHDADAAVCQLCELTLSGRGLSAGHILMARRITDLRPSVRLEVLSYLEHHPELDAGVWLERLCRDPAPAVRAAAIRAAAGHPTADLRGNLRQMAQQDSSPTVRQLATHYLMHPFGN